MFMRYLAICVIAACSRQPTTTATTSAATADAAPITGAAPLPSPVPAALPESTAKCPVGDMTNVAVYSFLERELEDAAKHDQGRAETKALMRREAELRTQPDMKPPRASIIERELSHALTTLCNGSPGCHAIGLYNRSGLAIALSSKRTVVAPLGFSDAVWAELRKANADGETKTIDGETYVVFPVKHGVALCIVEA